MYNEWNVFKCIITKVCAYKKYRKPAVRIRRSWRRRPGLIVANIRHRLLLKPLHQLLGQLRVSFVFTRFANARPRYEVLTTKGESKYNADKMDSCLFLSQDGLTFPFRSFPSGAVPAYSCVIAPSSTGCELMNILYTIITKKSVSCPKINIKRLRTNTFFFVSDQWRPSSDWIVPIEKWLMFKFYVKTGN